MVEQRQWAKRDYFCLECGRQMYQAKRGPSGPGQAQFAAHDLCTACYKVRGREKVKPWGLSKRTGPGFTICTECDRPMSPATSRVEGTLEYGAGGRCVTCVRRERYRAAHPGAPRHQMLDWSQEHECHGCGRRLRPAGHKADGVTVAHLASGMCRTCHDRARGVSRTQAPPRLRRAQVTQDADLERFVAARRARKTAQAAAAARARRTPARSSGMRAAS